MNMPPSSAKSCSKRFALDVAKPAQDVIFRKDWLNKASKQNMDQKLCRVSYVSLMVFPFHRSAAFIGNPSIHWLMKNFLNRLIEHNIQLMTEDFGNTWLAFFRAGPKIMKINKKLYFFPALAVGVISLVAAINLKPDLPTKPAVMSPLIDHIWPRTTAEVAPLAVGFGKVVPKVEWRESDCWGDGPDSHIDIQISEKARWSLQGQSCFKFQIHWITNWSWYKQVGSKIKPNSH